MERMKGETAKGQGWLLVILIIVAIVVIGYYLSQQPNGFKFPGTGTTTQPITYSNNVITIENKIISNKNPFTSDETTISFEVVNRGDKTIKGIKVEFLPLTGFTKSELICGLIVSTDGKSCTFDLESLDSKEVRMRLTTSDKLITITQTTVSFEISYPHEAARLVRIPIVSDLKLFPSDVKYSVSDSTFGPLQISVKPPAGRTRTVGSTQVIEPFAFYDSAFRFEFSLSDAGSVSGARIERTKLKGEELKLTLNNFAVTNCDKVSPSSLTLKDTTDGEEIPFTVICSMRPTEQVKQTLSSASSPGYTFGSVTIDLKYVYKFAVSDTIAITPLQEGGEGTPSGEGAVSCTEGEKQSCTTSDGLQGQKTCVKGQFTDCVPTQPTK